MNVAAHGSPAMFKKKNMDNSGKVILDLCGGTGAWSRPYKDAGYHVINVSLPWHDVRYFTPPQSVYGVLAAPPCTDFTKASACHWHYKDTSGQTLDSLSVITACLRIVAMSYPVFWCLENPVGRLKNWLGKPVLYFDPWEYGDPYTKKTGLWGRFSVPARSPVPVPAEMRRYICDMPHTKNRSDKRALTPPGFARAFYEANK